MLRNAASRKRTRQGGIFVLLAVLLGSLFITIIPSPGAVAASSPTYTLFSHSTVVPVVPAVDNDPNSVELGVRFRAVSAGSVTGVSFYKGTGNTGVHTGSLWTNGGTKLASGTFTNETVTGWQTLTFTVPVKITAATTYVASYHAPVGAYADDQGYFSQTYTTGKLSVPSNGGVYVYGSAVAFPHLTWNASNYYVDVQFSPTVVPPTTTTTMPTTTVTTTTPPTTTIPPTTTVPPTTTTVPPTTTTVPPVGNWPTAANTGASGSLADVTPPSGELILDQNNQVLSNTRVHGVVTVTGCNVTLSNVEVDTGEAFTGDSTPDQFAIWLKEDPGPSCGATLDHVSVLTNSAGAAPYTTEAVRDAYGGPSKITFSKFVGQQLGVTEGSGSSMSDSYIELAPTMRGDHNEDILEDGINGLNLTHNTFLNQNDQTSTLSLFTEFGNNSNELIQDNLMAGGGYTCYCGDGATDNAGAPARAVNVSFINNVFWEKYFPTVGAFGPARAYNPAGGGQWTNNVYALADGTVTTQLVPQPPLDGQ